MQDRKRVLKLKFLKEFFSATTMPRAYIVVK